MVENTVICDTCNHKYPKDELNLSFFCFITKFENSGLIHKKNFLSCYRHICKQCIVDIAEFAKNQGLVEQGL